MRLGFLGTGTIAAAVVEGLAVDGHDIMVSQRSAAHSARLAAAYECVEVGDNQRVLDSSDVIFLGLMAEAAPDILSSLQFRSDQQVISFMAGADMAQLADLVAPATAAAIMVPFPGIAQGGSPVMMLGDVDLVTGLFGPRNTVYALASEDELAGYICAQAVLSPAVKMVAEAAQWLGERVQDTEQGEGFLRHLVGSSLLGSDCAPLLTALNTPGGYNQRLRQHMEESGMGASLQQGLDGLFSDG